MTTILSWNIQNGLGVDGKRSLPRIAQVIHELGGADVLCLQEVSRHLPFDKATDAPDQVAELAELFPAHEPIFGAAYDIRQRSNGTRVQYGNLIMSRLPVLSRFYHGLPQPPAAGEMQMPRQMTEVTVAGADGSLRIMTTHLAFHLLAERRAQVAAIRSIHESIVRIEDNPPKQIDAGPYQAFDRASRAVICGDLNCLPDSTELALLLAESALPAAQLHDAWRLFAGAQDHQPSCGIYDGAQWPQGAHCRDYFAVSEALRDHVLALETETLTYASDHQPILLTLRKDASSA